MRTSVLLIAVLSLAACGPASPNQPVRSNGGTSTTAYPTDTAGSSGGAGGNSGTEQGMDAGTGAGDPAPPTVTYSLDCTGYAYFASDRADLTYHYETRDDGHVLTHCSGTDSFTGDSESQSNDWGPDAGDVEAIRRGEGDCGFVLAVQGGADGGGFSLYKAGKTDGAVGWYYEQGPLNQTEVYWSPCSVTTP